MPGVRSRPFDDLLWLLPLGLALLLLHQLGRLLADIGVVIAWATATLLIGLGGFLRQRIRRRAWLTAYVAPTSPLARWLRGGVVLLATRLLLAAALAVILLAGIPRLHGPDELLLMLAALPLLVLLRSSAERLFAPHISEHYLPEAAWRCALLTTFVLLCAALLAAALWRPGPDFSDATLEQAAWHLAAREDARSDLLARVLTAAGALEGVRWWLAQHALPRLDWPLLLWLGWALVLVKSAVLVWAWLHCCAGAMLLRTLWERHHVPSP